MRQVLWLRGQVDRRNRQHASCSGRREASSLFTALFTLGGVSPRQPPANAMTVMPLSPNLRYILGTRTRRIRSQMLGFRATLQRNSFHTGTGHFTYTFNSTQSSNVRPINSESNLTSTRCCRSSLCQLGPEGRRLWLH